MGVVLHRLMLVMSVALFRLKYRVDPVSKSLGQELKLRKAEPPFEDKARPLLKPWLRREQPQDFLS